MKRPEFCSNCQNREGGMCDTCYMENFMGYVPIKPVQSPTGNAPAFQKGSAMDRKLHHAQPVSELKTKQVTIKKGMFTGLLDSDQRMICAGNVVRYEYIVGFTRDIFDGKERKIHCIPFEETEEAAHETVMEYEVRGDMAGFFLDKPREMSFTYATPHTLRYFVVTCPDCEHHPAVEFDQAFETDRYGFLRYYKCPDCKETFVRQNNEELAVAANHR